MRKKMAGTNCFMRNKSHGTLVPRRNKGFSPIIALAAVFVLALTGCGGEYANSPGMDADGVSGAAVSGEAVSGSAVFGEADPESSTYDEADAVDAGTRKYPYKNDNFYVTTGALDVLTQYRLDGTVEEVDESNKLRDPLWVDNEWLYYSEFKPKKETTDIWRAPLKKQGEGVHIEWGESEKLFSPDYYIHEDGFYVNERYMVYMGEEDIYRYDFQEQKERPLGMKNSNFAFDSSNYVAAAERGISFVLDSEVAENLYYLDLERWKTYPVYKETEELIGIVQIGRTACFCPDSESVWKYEIGAKAAESFLPKAQLKKEIDRVVAGDDKMSGADYTWQIEDIFSYGSKMYLDVCLEWEKEEEAEEGLLEGENVSVQYNTHIMLGCSAGDASTLAYEKGLSQSVKYSDEYKSSAVYRQWITYYADESGEFMGIIGDNMFLLLPGDRDGGTHQMGCYNMKTGEFRYLTEKDEEYYSPYYVGWNGYMEYLP